MHVAIIIGGAECVGEDLTKALGVCHAAGITPELFITNDMIGRFNGSVRAVTLHVRKLDDWLTERQRDMLTPPLAVWANRQHRLVTHVSKDWGGSVGLFAVKVARELGFRRIILAGIPMTVEHGHFIRRTPWRDALIFRRIWLMHKAEIAPFVRSFSGWTNEVFGPPTVDFVKAA